MNISDFKGKRVFIIGNGGSFANAEHMANDLLLKGVAAFTMNAATLTCFANDFGYEEVFDRWLSVVARKGDVLIALSGSGKSRNILDAIDFAKRIGMRVIKVFGAGLKMQAAEEDQLKWMHDICFPKTS